MAILNAQTPWPANLNVICGMRVSEMAVVFLLRRHEFASHQVHIKARSHAEEMMPLMSRQRERSGFCAQ